MDQKSKILRHRNTQIAPRDISESLGKVPPQALDVEEAILGAIMLERGAMETVIDILSPYDFYIEQHQVIFEAIQNLHNTDRPIDMRTVFSELSKMGKLEIAGGAAYIAELTSRVSSAAHIEYHARIIQEQSMRRRIITSSSQAINLAYDETQDVFEQLETLQSELDGMGNKYLRGNFLSITDVAKESYNEMVNRKDVELTGVPTGSQRLDLLLAGWQKTDLVIIAARPGMGKTAFVIASACCAALQHKRPVAFFSLEMGRKQLANRIWSAETEIDLFRILKRYLTPSEFDRLGEASKRIYNAPLYIDDTPAITILEFRARARRMVRELGVQLIIVDYLQLMRGDGNGNRDQEIGSITRALKQVAKELDVPVIALSQLSRGVETRGGDKRPQLSDLRESGNIEQDADIVMFLYRAEYYKITQDSDGLPTDGVMEVVIAKHRQGALDSIPVKFLKHLTKVVDWTNAPTPTNITAPTGPTEQPRAPYIDKDDDLPF